MRILLTMLLITSYISLFAQAQNGTIKGKVYNKDTKQTLPDVQIIIDNTVKYITENDGYYEINTDTGTIRVIYMLFGYETVTRSISLGTGITVINDVYLDASLNELNEVVVSADKIEKRVSDLSVSVNIIKQENIINKHVTNAEDIIKQSQGIEINDGQMSIRGGSGFSYGAGSRVLALTDGLPVLSADAGNIRWQFLPVENLKQIEIIKGASSVLYGSSALNGIVNFISAESDTVPKFTYKISSGIFDKPKRKELVWWNSPRTVSDAAFSFSRKKNKTDISSSLHVLYDNGYRKRNDEKTALLNLKLSRSTGKKEDIEYGIRLSGGYNIKTDFILWENADSGALIQNEATATELNALFLTIDPFISLKGNPLSKHDLRMRFQFSDNQYPENNANNSNANSFFIDYQFNRKLFDKMNVILGVSDMYSSILSKFYGDHTSNNSSAFAQLEYKPVKKLKFIAGFRAEYNITDSIADEIAPVFRAGINYSPGKNTFLRASFGQGYRYPSVAEKFAYTSLGSVKIFPNIELKPETGWSSEIGIKQGIRSGKLFGHLDLSFFLSENKDMIEYIFGLYPDPYTNSYDFGFKSSNIENSRIYGTEAIILFRREFNSTELNISGGYTYVFPTDLSGSFPDSETGYLKYRRKHAAQLNLNMSFRKFEAQVNTYCKSKVLKIDDVFLDPLTREYLLPGFFDYWTTDNTYIFTADLILSYRISESINISIAVKNITNKEYSDRPGNILPHRFFGIQVNGNL